MNYIGSKYTLLPFLQETIKNVVGDDLSDKVFCDIFSGTGAVGKAFKPQVLKVIANDIEYYSYVLNRNYIGNHIYIEGLDNYLNALNNMDNGEGGFIYNNYCIGSGSGRQYYSDENGKKIDAVRNQIEEWKLDGTISDDVYFFLLSSLIESADRVANTASVYGAFLKHLKKSASKPIIIKPAVFEINSNHHDVYCEDANELIKKISGNILYLDPPYNARQYGANYHILNALAEYKAFVPKGKTGLGNYYKSDYCRKKTVTSKFETLIKEAEFDYIFLSYNNEGLMSQKTIQEIMSRYGHYDYVTKEYHRFRADKPENRNHLSDRTLEYIHILEK